MDPETDIVCTGFRSERSPSLFVASVQSADPVVSREKGVCGGNGHTLGLVFISLVAMSLVTHGIRL